MRTLWNRLPKKCQDFLIRRTPNFLVRLLYGAVLWLFRFRVRRHFRSSKIEIWPRHSFVLGTFVPFVSDLDLTIFTPSDVSPVETQKIRDEIESISKIFPAFGEVNLYLEADQWLSADFMHRLELSRDPRFSKKITLDDSSRNRKISSAIFLFRMLDSDWRNLKIRPQVRVKKWRAHLASIANDYGRDIGTVSKAAPPDLATLSSLLFEILDLDAETRLDCENHLRQYFQLKEAGKTAWEVQYPQRMWALAPHVMIYGYDQPSELSGTLAEFFIGQLNWEIWGLGTQYILTERKTAFLDHLAKLKALLHQSLMAPEFAAEVLRLDSGIDRLTGRINSVLAECRNDSID
jgi:hypothetical protein